MGAVEAAHLTRLLGPDCRPIGEGGLCPVGEIYVACFSLTPSEHNGNDSIYSFIADIPNSFRITEQFRYVPATRNIRQAIATFYWTG